MKKELHHNLIMFSVVVFIALLIIGMAISTKYLGTPSPTGHLIFARRIRSSFGGVSIAGGPGGAIIKGGPGGAIVKGGPGGAIVTGGPGGAIVKTTRKR